MCESGAQPGGRALDPPLSPCISPAGLAPAPSFNPRDSLGDATDPDPSAWRQLRKHRPQTWAFPRLPLHSFV